MLQAFRKKISAVRKSSRGFTLVEALVTILLFSILGGACLLILLSGSDSWQINNTQVTVQQELRKAIDWMREDLWEAGSFTITNVPNDGAWYPALTFRTSAGVTNGAITWSANTIQLALGGTSGTDLNRTSNGVTKILARNIQTLQFRRQASTPKLLEISILARSTTTRGMPVSVSSTYKINMRN